VVKDAQIKSFIVGFPYHQFVVAKSTRENENPYLWWSHIYRLETTYHL
jgi:hypothetical protein